MLGRPCLGAVLLGSRGLRRPVVALPSMVLQQQQHHHHQVLAPPACLAPGQHQDHPDSGAGEAHTLACSQPSSAGSEQHHGGSNGSNGSSNGNGNGSHSCNGSSSSGSRTVFSGSSAAQLQAWLEAHGVDTSGYGSGLAKTVQDLLEEQSRAESVLSIEDGGVAQRTVRVLSLHVLNDKQEVLYEAEQILPDGRSRKRQVAVSEKLVGDECWRAAVDRAIHEELSMALPAGYKVEVLDGTYRRFEELSTSMSYPGLLTKYVFHRVSARLPGLPSGPFETREARPGGHLITRWAWKDARQWEQQCAATSSQG